MRYTKIKAEMIKAFYDFCMEQTESCEYTDSEVKSMINTAFEELKKFNCSCLPVSEIKRFELSVSSGYTKEILPPFEEKEVLSLVKLYALHRLRLMNTALPIARICRSNAAMM